MNVPSFAPFALLSVLVAGADYWIKRLIETRFEMHVAVDVLPFLAIFRTHNTGIAFSMFNQFPAMWLVALPLIIIMIVLYLALRTEPRQKWARAGFALIIGGAVGNLFDRALLGYVVDYVMFHIGEWSFAIFNFADACITVGAGLVIFQEFVDWLRTRHLPRDRT